MSFQNHDRLDTQSPKTRNPWAWVPSLYFAEGVPYVLVNVVSVIMYKRLGASLSEIGFWTSLLYLPWVIKPLWGPLVDLYWTKRRWSALMQVMMGLLFGVAALSLLTASPLWWWLSLAALGVTGRVLVVLGDGDGVAARSFRNLPEVQLINSRELNAYDVLVNDCVVFTRDNLPTTAVAEAEEAK